MTASMILVLIALSPDMGTRAPAPVAHLPNPASALCVAHGAKIEFETDENGGQKGICVFPDGTRMSEWTYFRNKSRLAK